MEKNWGVLCCGTLYFYCKSYGKGKKLDKIETRIYGKRARIILAIEFIMAIFLGIYGFSLLAKGIATAHLVLATGLIIGSVKKFWM